MAAAASSKGFEPIVYASREDWMAEATRRFGPEKMNWKFVCPICGHVASARDYKDAGGNTGDVGVNCVGRLMEFPRKAFGGQGPGPCNYTQGGLFKLAPVQVLHEEKEHWYFDFAPAVAHMGCCRDSSCTPETCMVLPLGKSCKDCKNLRHCVAMYGVKPENNWCDFHPRRFREVARA